MSVLPNLGYGVSCGTRSASEGRLKPRSRVGPSGTDPILIGCNDEAQNKQAPREGTRAGLYRQRGAYCRGRYWSGCNVRVGMTGAATPGMAGTGAGARGTIVWLLGTMPAMTGAGNSPRTADPPLAAQQFPTLNEFTPS